MARKPTPRSKSPNHLDKVEVPGGSLSASETPDQTRALNDLRQRIDQLDAKLVALLNERAGLVVEVGKAKQRSGTPIYAPHREAEVLQRALDANAGPLSDRTIEGVFRELMSGSFALEHPLRIGYLGPPGSYSHIAAIKQFGSTVSPEDLHTIAGVVTEVRRGHVNYGLVPIENSTGGGITETMTALQEHAGHVYVYAEVQIAIHHALLANCEPSQIRRIHSKPEVLEQCRMWLATQFPAAELIAAPSSSRAAQTAVDENRSDAIMGAPPGSAAVGSTLAGQLYGLNVLFEEIEDNPNNITRFYILSQQRAKRSGDDKTSVMFNTIDKPGALVSVLSVFDRAKINLTHIDKRPSGRDNWQYTFFVDAQGHQDDPVVAEALAEASQHCRELIVLGSFPRSKRIL
ncbi:MAG: prephenate dehydratase [Phycisphaeraceae bacterium]|nr:prephenate dehydratase [Phycisphaeraceae bacterium]MCW5761927.1 prephenate dehydratase [Phycisphaeraceae bacterium]